MSTGMFASMNAYFPTRGSSLGLMQKRPLSGRYRLSRKLAKPAENEQHRPEAPSIVISNPSPNKKANG